MVKRTVRAEGQGLGVASFFSVAPDDGAILAVVRGQDEFRPVLDDHVHVGTASSWIVGAARQSPRTWGFINSAPVEQRAELYWFVREAASTETVCRYMTKRFTRNPVSLVFVFERAVDCIEAAAPRATLLADAVLAAEQVTEDTEKWLSPREAAAELGFKSPNTMKSWIDKGYFHQVVESPGGHVKIALSDVERVRRAMTARAVWQSEGRLVVEESDKELEQLL